MNNTDYWLKRKKHLYNKIYKDADKVERRMIEIYIQSFEQINNKISKLFVNFSDDVDLNLKEANKLIKGKEFNKWFKTGKQYYNEILETGNKQLALEYKVLAMKSRISRLEKLKVEIMHELAVLGVNKQQLMDEYLNGVIDYSYYNTIYEFQKFNGINNFAKLNKSFINELLNYPWSGSNYSQNIWKDTNKLVDVLSVELTKSITQGKSYKETSKTIAKRMHASLNNARTLVQTETAYFAEEVTKKGYFESNIEQYEILATLDLRTSSICRKQDGKVYKLNKWVVGKTAPPFHPRCRTTTIPHYEDIEFNQRIHRDPVTGKSKYLLEDMNYSTWYNKYVKDGSKALINEKKIKNKTSDKKQYLKYRGVLGKEILNSFDKFQELKYNNSNEWKKVKANYNKTILFNKIVKQSSNLNIKGKVIKDINRIDISDYKFAEFHINSERSHSVNKNMAQNYINNAKVAYGRWNGQVIVYVSENGCSVVNLKNKIISTAYKSDEYDDKFKKLMEVLKDD